MSRMDFLPGPTSGGIRVLCLEAFANDTLMPLWYGNAFRGHSNPIPQRLEIIDLLSIGKLSNPGGGLRIVSGMQRPPFDVKYIQNQEVTKWS
jgi:hypothetical protein